MVQVLVKSGDGGSDSCLVYKFDGKEWLNRYLLQYHAFRWIFLVKVEATLCPSKETSLEVNNYAQVSIICETGSCS